MAAGRTQPAVIAAGIGNNVDKLCWYTAQDFGTL
jgi:hypothetical protein